MAYYIDTHVHLYDEAFGDEVDEVVGRSLEAGVGMMIQPDVDGKERRRMIEITERHGEVMRCMLGLYPGSVDEGWEKEVEEIRDMVDRVWSVMERLLSLFQAIKTIHRIRVTPFIQNGFLQLVF